MRQFVLWAVLATACLLLVRCDSAAGEEAPPPAATRLRVVATTSIVADVVGRVGGDRIGLTVLMPPGTDPHAFQPRPQEVALVSDADVLFANGAGLETFLEALLESAGAQDAQRVVEVSAGIELLPAGGEHEGEDEAHGHDAQRGDPHTWTDPNNLLVWVATIERALSALDPAGAESFHANAAAYRAELEALDVWIREQVAQVPPAGRMLVTDHQIFGYFAARYGFTQAGAIFPGASTLAEPSAQELAALEDAIRELGVKVVFVGSTVNPSLAQRVAEDTGTRLVTLHTGSLTRGGDADTYLDYVRTNVSAMVEALR